MLRQLICAGVLGVLACLGISPARAVPVLWGIDEQDGELVSIADYTKLPLGPAAAGVVVHGPLRYDRNGAGNIQDIGPHIESFAIEDDGTAYFVRNFDVNRGGALADVPIPVLFKYDVDELTMGATLVSTVIGHVPAPGFDEDRDDNISGLALDPLTGALLALHRVDDAGVVDRLLVISKTDGSVIANIGELKQGALEILSAEDMAFDNAGRLFVTDNQTDQLWRVELNPARTAILSMVVVDNNQPGGLGVSGQFETEALAYDYEGLQLVGHEDQNALYYLQNQAHGANLPLLEYEPLSDVEGMDFRGSVPEPGSAALALVGAVGVLLVIRRRRR